MWSDDDLVSSEEEEDLIEWQNRVRAAAAARAGEGEDEADRETDGGGQVNMQPTYAEQCATAMAEFRQGAVRIDLCNIRRFPRLSDALARLVDMQPRQTSALHCFARDKPSPDDSRARMNHKKEYMVATLRNFFRFCSTLETGRVYYDETLQSAKPNRVVFDIEIKQETAGDINALDSTSVLKQHTRSLGIEATDEVIERLAALHDRVAVSELDEAECKAGKSVAVQHICQLMTTTIPEYDFGGGDDDLSILTRCRSSKFSMHVVLNRVFCESILLSMKLFVFEIARKFVFENTEWLVAHEHLWETPEGKFRARALMILSMLSHYNRDGQGRWTFRGYNDSMFDEAIYEDNHLLAGPGSCKVKQFSSSAALAPIVSSASPMIVAEQNFDQLFQGRDGFARWKRHLSVRPLDDTETHETYLLCEWKPSLAYPLKRKWNAQYRQNTTTVAELRGSFDHVVCGGCPFAPYEEKRLMFNAPQHLTNGERNLAVSDVSAEQPREAVYPDQV